MKRQVILFAAMSAFFGVAGFAWANPEPPADSPGEILKGKALYTTCAGCHGNAGEGRAEMGAPRLAGQDADYLTRQLQNFRQGLRGDRQDPSGYMMRARANALQDDIEVHQVIAWIRQLPVVVLKAGSAAPAAQMTKGSTLYPACAACHGARGEGNKDMMAPALQGLTQAYVATELRNFRKGARGANARDSNGSTMAAAAKTLSDDRAIDAVAGYSSSLR